MTLHHAPFDAAFNARPQAAGSASPSARHWRLLVVALPVVAALLLALPGQAKARSQPAPGFAAALPAPPPPRVADGSIFNVSAGYAGLAEGRRARAVGDPLTILLVEQLSSSKTAAGKTQKNGAVNVVPPATGIASFLSRFTLNASGTSSFNGQGTASQTSTLGGDVAVTIAEVRPNGTALVKGEKRLMLSQGQEWVQISGIVRLGDIDVDNRVPSTQVADARIEYSGNGAVGRASREGWFSKFFNMISPF
jgi:flagellar L-ring protein FlgH